MKCPFCGYLEDKVVDSRESREGEAIRRRRECLRCERRFTSYERIDEIPYMVVKKDGRREPFDRNKVMAGILRACEKRPVPSAKLDGIVNAIEKYVQESSERERPTSKIGEMIMRRLKELDKVAYVRFASVYLEFEDVSAIYVISKRKIDKRKKGHHALVCIGQTESLLGEIKRHKKGKCVKKYQANVISILPEENEKKRLRIETDLKAAHTVVCNLE